VEPQTPVARVLWLDHTVEGLTHEIISIRAQIRALVLSSLALEQTDQSLSDLLHQQLELMERQCALVRVQLAHLHADLTGSPLSGTSMAASTEAQEPRRAADEPDEP
jgi:hypothetical protein